MMTAGSSLKSTVQVLMLAALPFADAFWQAQWGAGLAMPLRQRGKALGARGLRSVAATQNKQKVAVIGSGAIGLYYGARLQEIGHDVSYLARGEFESLKQNGLRVESVDGDLNYPEVQVYNDTKQIGDVDWVVLALKSTSMHRAADLIAPCVGEDTRILAIMNGLGIEDALARDFKADKIFGAMAFTNNYRDDGIVKHVKYGKLNIGHYYDKPDELDRVTELFSGSKVPVDICPCLQYSRWHKLSWNLPFNGLAVATGGSTTDKIMNDEGLRSLAAELIGEIVDVANKDLDEREAPEEYRLSDKVVNEMLELTESLGEYRPSTAVDFVAGRPMEVKHIFSVPVERAQELGCDIPSVRTLATVVSGVNKLRGDAPGTNQSPIPSSVQRAEPVSA